MRAPTMCLGVGARNPWVARGQGIAGAMVDPDVHHGQRATMGARAPAPTARNLVFDARRAYAFSDMAPLFVAQELADRWISDDVVTLDGDEMILPAAPRVRLRTEPAVYFVRLDDGGDDPYDIVGSVKTARELAAMGADHVDDSVLVGDCAYTVVPGFLGQAVHASGATLDGASWHELLYALEHVAGAA